MLNRPALEEHLENQAIYSISRPEFLTGYKPGRRVFVQAKLFSAQLPKYS